jgi:hypothetical protein
VAEDRQPVRVFIGCGLAVVAAGAAGALTDLPWLFPSLGPMAMLHIGKPEAEESSPRNTLIGHAVALLAGYGLLAACGLTDNPSVLQEGIGLPRIAAAAGSLALTAAVLLAAHASHPPAGATTLIVSLGLLSTPTDLAVAAAAVTLVTAADWLFNRATGQAMPIWYARPAQADAAHRGLPQH